MLVGPWMVNDGRAVIHRRQFWYFFVKIFWQEPSRHRRSAIRRSLPWLGPCWLTLEDIRGGVSRPPSFPTVYTHPCGQQTTATMTTTTNVKSVQTPARACGVYRCGGRESPLKVYYNVLSTATVYLYNFCLRRLLYITFVAYVEDEKAKTKYGFAPTYPPSLGVQSLAAGVGPVPKNPEARDWLDYVIRRNAFTIKPTDRSLLFDIRLVSVSSGGGAGGGGGGSSSGERNSGDTSVDGGSFGGGGTSGGGGGGGVGVGCHPAGGGEQIGAVNDKSEDGGASWWTAALPRAGDYCGG